MFERGRVVDVARGSSEEEPPPDRCKFRKKLKPLRPEGRCEVELAERAVAVGAIGAGAVYIDREGQCGAGGNEGRDSKA